jgi:hypothetical protein
LQALVAVDDDETKDVLSQSFEICFPDSEVFYTNSGKQCLEI